MNPKTKNLLKALWSALKPILLAALGGGIVSATSGCSALQVPSSKTQTSSIFALGLPAVVITHGATQEADYSGGDTNSQEQTQMNE